MRTLYEKIRTEIGELGNLEKAVPQGGSLGTRALRRIAWAARQAGSAHAAPAQLGLAVLVGVTVGLTPLFGFHLLICLLLAAVMRLNKVVVYVAANVSLPPFVPVIAVACIQVGHFAVHGRLLTLDAYSLEQLRRSFLYYWFVGALLNGLAVGGLAGTLVWATAASGRRRAGEPPSPLARLYAAFLPEGRMTAEIMRGKVRHDTVYDEVVRLAGVPSSLLDVGGGYGTLTLLLALAQPALGAARVVDWDAAKLDLGARAAVRLGLPVSFVRADVFQLADFGAPVDCVTCIDLLHYADLARQRVVVAKLAAALRPGGRLLIRDMDADLRWRTAFTVVQERLSLLVRRTLAGAIVPRSGRDLEAQLVACGLAVSSRRCYGSTPFSNTLWVAERRG